MNSIECFLPTGPLLIVLPRLQALVPVGRNKDSAGRYEAILLVDLFPNIFGSKRSWGERQLLLSEEDSSDQHVRRASTTWASPEWVGPDHWSQTTGLW